MDDGGLARVQRKMARMAEAVHDAARLAMEKSAEEIVTLMRNLVAVDDGDLRDSIGWTFGNAPKYSQRIGKIEASDGDLIITIYAGNSKVYAHLVEFGSAAHLNGGMFAGTKNPGAPAQPFFYVSYRSNKKRAAARTKRAVKKAARKVWDGN
ncbi:HK97 gp10 family phage protein [Phyllobacterium bourgognense]|uniref:Bacteriophage HK97-gp10 putative tail-component n=1 Tax=Phyllobacterium bourgognense TaxID=314236 RepID=A0A368YL27_9HYPH|nr:HK97 gp10 family phage protein [Phyllobacterium bourgognense]RCW80930.1 bacteriophage HK97-gp10 putative tail-component [Phyllobacterium bourgognense]